jgi:Ca2+-binding EF-hand superfamily protein
MQVAGTTGVSAALLLQRLFSSGSAMSDSSQDTSAAGQTLPGGNVKAKAAGASLPMMADGTMSAMVGMQTQGPPPQPSASDVASNLIDALDTNGDGVVSAEELQKGLSASGSGSNADAASAIARIDTDGDGNVSKDELASAVQSGMDARKAAQAGDVAMSLISATDTDNDGALSLDEVAKALGKTGDADKASLQQAFSSIDTDGDGKVSKDELTKAVETHQEAHKAHHGHHGHRAGQAAESLISATDTDGDDALSLDEIAKALDKTSDADKASLQTAFASMDKDGDGKLNQDELTSVIKETMANAARAYAQAATASETAQAA